MKISSLYRIPSILLLAILDCSGTRIGSPKRDKNDLYHHHRLERPRGAIAKKPYVRDESIPLVEGNTQQHTQHERKNLECKANERVLTFYLVTDDYGYETSFEWSAAGGIMLDYGPKNGWNYENNTPYFSQYCVTVGWRYKLKINDLMRDGFCCDYGMGTYKVKIDGETIYDANSQKTFTDVAEHIFLIEPPPPSNQDDNNFLSAVVSGKTDGQAAPDPDGCVKVTVKSDNYPDEISWKILNRNGNTVATSPVLKALVPVTKEVCLPSGPYEFIMRGDGDGVCCSQGQGYFIVSKADGTQLLKGGHFQFQKKYKIHINPEFENQMSPRDIEWLTAHNERRLKYHTRWGTNYVPLQWSPQLSADAERWAKQLLNRCEYTKGSLKHEPDVEEGENLANNKGTGSWATQRPADAILKRWVEDELAVGYPNNAHMTQVLWRPSRYLGCGDASKSYSGGTCRVQVCRYATAGNCGMGQMAMIGSNWKTPMLADDSNCAPECAPEGCW